MNKGIKGRLVSIALTKHCADFSSLIERSNSLSRALSVISCNLSLQIFFAIVSQVLAQRSNSCGSISLESLSSDLNTSSMPLTLIPNSIIHTNQPRTKVFHHRICSGRSYHPLSQQN